MTSLFQQHTQQENRPPDPPLTTGEKVDIAAFTLILGLTMLFALLLFSAGVSWLMRG
jgi:hypothetical protein